MAVTRSMSITYGSQVVPASGTGYVVDLIGVHQVSMEYRQLSLEFSVAITGTGTDAQFAAALQALRDSFRTPNQSLTITVEGEEQFAGTSSGHTFMAALPSLTPLPEYQSARSHAFRVKITGKLPADLSGQGGRFSANVRISRTPQERRTVQVTAEYSGLGGTSASGHESTFDTYADAVVGALTGTYELSTPTSVQRDDFDHGATFSRVYQELLSDQSGTETNDSRLVNTLYKVTTDSTAAEVAKGSGGAPPKRVRVEFSTGILVSAGVTEAFVVSTVILPFLQSRAALGGAGGQLHVVSERVSVDLRERTASGYVDFLSYAGSRLLAASVDQEEYLFDGKQLVPVLDGKDPFAKDLHEGPKLRTLSVRIYAREEGKSPKVARQLENEWKSRLEREGWVLLEVRRPKAERDLTQANGAVTSNFVESGAVMNFEWVGRRRR